jgi:alpha,alpha-trehalase
LNAFLYNAEMRLSAFYARLGRSDDARRFEARAAKRQEVMHATFWDATQHRWRDVLGDGTWASSGPCLSDYAPLWAGIGPPDGDIEGLLAGLEASGLLREHGVQCTVTTTGEQWDAPNAWPPLQDLLVDGLLKLKHESASLLARRVGTAWLASVRAGFETSGACFEKYDADQLGRRGAGGEYAPQDGFGWTNGAAMVMAGRFRCEEAGAA